MSTRTTHVSTKSTQTIQTHQQDGEIGFLFNPANRTATLHPIQVTRVVDGDTVDAVVKWEPFQISIGPIRCRLHALNCPETRTRDKDEKRRGIAAKEYMTEVCERESSHLVAEFLKKGKYGRYIINLYVRKGDTLVSINQMLIDDGHAVLKVY